MKLAIAQMVLGAIIVADFALVNGDFALWYLTTLPSSSWAYWCLGAV